MIKCAECCLKCLEKIADYINKAAYAYMAVSGDSFCTSAWNGFLLNIKHTLKFSWAHFLAGMFIFLGKVAITVLNVFSCYMMMKYVTKNIDQVSPIPTCAIVGLITFISASTFLGLFDEAVLAMLTCLAIDCDLHEGEPKFGPPTFHDALEGFNSDEKKKDAIADGGWDKEKGNDVN